MKARASQSDQTRKQMERKKITQMMDEITQNLPSCRVNYF
jgi:hypothetical protein